MNRWLLLVWCLSFQVLSDITEARIVSPVPAAKIFAKQQFRSPTLSPDAHYIAVFGITAESTRIGFVARVNLAFYPHFY